MSPKSLISLLCLGILFAACKKDNEIPADNYLDVAFRGGYTGSLKNAITYRITGGASYYMEGEGKSYKLSDAVSDSLRPYYTNFPLNKLLQENKTDFSSLGAMDVPYILIIPHQQHSRDKQFTFEDTMTPDYMQGYLQNLSRTIDNCKLAR